MRTRAHEPRLQPLRLLVAALIALVVPLVLWLS